MKSIALIAAAVVLLIVPGWDRVAAVLLGLGLIGMFVAGVNEL